MLPPIPVLADYGISPEYGFLPHEPPLEVLSDPYYAKWESVVSNMQSLLLNSRLREVVDNLPELSTEYLRTEQEWRRAYVVLVFMLHAYVWGEDKPKENIPPQLTVPLFQVCKHLEVPPVATYAGVCLWNYKPIFPDEPVDLGNLACVNTFTGSMDEQWFYLVSVAIEACGAPSISLMLRAISAARFGDSEEVTECLQHFAEIISEVVSVLQRMNKHCDPHVFYHRIRPYLAGSKNMGDAGLPNGLMYDDGTGKKEYRQYGGGSNAQSSLIQFFDIALGIEHRPTGVGRNDSSTLSSVEDGVAPKPRHNFIHEMREYMPGPHRRFLEHVEAVANIREFVKTRQSDKALCSAYDGCLTELRMLRDKHIQIVSQYIIIKSRESRANSSPRTGPPAMNLSTIRYDDNSPSKSPNKKLRGTGGTALIPFLKQARDETEEPAVNPWARRLLRNGPVQPRSAMLSKVDEHADGHLEVVGLAGAWTADETEGGICHW